MKQLTMAMLVAAAIASLAACSTPAQNGEEVASAKGPPPECPIGTHICRRDGSAGPTDSVSAEEMRRQGATGVGGMRPGSMMNRGGGG